MASRVVNGQFAWSKWHLALAVGAVGIGIGYWYMRQPQQRGKLEQSKKSLSIDDGPEVPTNESPLQLAERYKNEGNLHFRKGKFLQNTY